ncbi:MAG: protein-export membrane protein SecD [Rhodocyclales bacterium GWA2_65_20]|nr:MAG: protein-export membrane protein SecD [Rhodocyclales bacterium GWA2_65_20]
MNRYPLWKNALVVIALVLGLFYTLPNFFGEVPAVQVASVKATIKVDAKLMSRVEDVLKSAGISANGFFADPNSIRARFADTDTQLKAKDAIEKALNPDPADATYSVALNLLSASPQWLTSIHALPMYLGLDLRGGVHFLLQVDMKGALTRRLDASAADLRTLLRDKSIRHAGIGREGQIVVIKFRDAEARDKARIIVGAQQPDLLLTEGQNGADFTLAASLKPEAAQTFREEAIKQNITTLHKRINELGVAEPVIQQQGADRIVVQLPGVQDVARAKDIIGRTATLEVRMVEQASVMGNEAPLGTELVPERRRDGTTTMVAVKKLVVLTGDRFNGAQATFDENQRPAVAIQLDSAGGRIMRDVTRENLKKMMAIILIEKGKPEAISVATIQGEFGNRFQITGMFSPEETNTLAILIRAGAIAAPMDIIEERVIGPSLGADNIQKGFHSTLGGFAAIALFMMGYYLLFGVVSVLALSANMLFLVALLSLLQATLTLPGIAAIALALGMAIDSNVLINERIREELRGGSTPQAAITAGYERAWATILDSNVTTLIVGLALLIFGSGAVRGFAVVHCLGITTSIFSSVVLSRALVNLIYGKRRKLAALSIGQVWKPGITAN